MDFQKIYQDLLNNQIEETSIENLFLETNGLFNIDSFGEIYKILSFLKKRGNEEFFLKLKKKLENNKGLLAKSYLFCFFEEYQTPENVKKMQEELKKDHHFSEPYPLDFLNIILEKMQVLGDFLPFPLQFEIYLTSITGGYNYSTQEISPAVFSSIHFDFLKPSNMYDLLPFYLFYYPDFVLALKNYLSKKKNVFYVSDFNTHMLLDLKEFSDCIFVHYGFNQALSLKDILFLDTILKNEMNYSKGFAFDKECYFLLYRYSLMQNDSKINPEFLKYISFQIKLSKQMDCLDLMKKGQEFRIGICNEDLIEATEKLKKSRRKDVRIVINSPSLLDKTNLESSLLQKLQAQNQVFIEFDSTIKEGRISVFDYVRAIEYYERIAREIEEYRFSPFEQYLYAFGLAKKFKKYRFFKNDIEEDREHPQFSRSPFLILKNNWIVCAGFTSYLREILTRLGFFVSDLFLNVKGEDSLNESHARLMLQMTDPKYGLDQYIIGDPTWDILSDSSYNHLNLTFEEDPLAEENIDAYYGSIYSIQKEGKTNPGNIREVLNQKIKPEIILKAYEEVLRKTSPNLSEKEIAKRLLTFKIQNNFIQFTEEEKNLSLETFYQLEEKDYFMQKVLIENIQSFTCESFSLKKEDDNLVMMIKIHIDDIPDIVSRKAIKSFFESKGINNIQIVNTVGLSLQFSLPLSSTFDDLIYFLIGTGLLVQLIVDLKLPKVSNFISNLKVNIPMFLKNRFQVIKEASKKRLKSFQEKLAEEQMKK